MIFQVFGDVTHNKGGYVTHNLPYSSLQVWVVKFSCVIKLCSFHTVQLIVCTEKSGCHCLLGLSSAC